MFGSNSDWYYKYIAGIKMKEGTRGWQQIVFDPHVWVPAVGKSICANLSSAQGSIATSRGRVAAAWSCLEENQKTCAVAPEYTDAVLSCGPGRTISKITFASFGVPIGDCDKGFSVNASCNSPKSLKVVEAACLGKNRCTVESDVNVLKGDPCGMVFKKLAVQTECSASSTGSPIFQYNVSIPVGSTSNVNLPTMSFDPTKVQIVEGTVNPQTIWDHGQFKAAPGITQGLAGEHAVLLSVGSGDYSFTLMK